MAEQLKNALAFNLAAGANVVIPHGLMTSLGVKLVPDVLFVPSDNITATADDTNVTLTNVGDITLGGAVLVESWHTVERAFGNKATTKLAPQPFVVSSAAAASGMNFAPARTLFVAKSWPVGADPLVYFTAISPALLQAATLLPTDANKVLIQIFPGTYLEDLTLVSNVCLVGLGGEEGTVQLDGNVTWLPSQGINASQVGTEVVTIDSITTQDAAKSYTIDSTAKVGGNVQIYISESIVQGFTVTGRNNVGGASDNFFFFNSTMFNTPANSVFTDWKAGGANNGVNIISSRFRGLTFAGVLGGTTARIQGGESTLRAGSLYTLTGASTVTFQGVNINNPISVAVGCTFTASACNIQAAMSGAGAFDVRGSNYNGNANLAGITGTCNRSTWIAPSVGPTVTGANPFPIAPPYPDAVYNVQLQPVGPAPGNGNVTITAKAGNSYTISDASAGGFSYDATIFHD